MQRQINPHACDVNTEKSQQQDVYKLKTVFPAAFQCITQQHIDQPTAVSDHFIFLAHSMGNIELVILELITSNRHAIRKARQAFMPQGTLLPSIARKAVPRVAP